jgi:glycerol-3-phosphate dehydrogenase
LNRENNLDALRGVREPLDIVVIGGGATGLGSAVDAASRGYRVALFEQNDFAKGTSSRSTKLIHGGVRYLQQGNATLVRDALLERGLLRKNAPHLVRALQFVIPTYRRRDSLYYYAGLKLYDALAGRHGFEKSRLYSRDETLSRICTIRHHGLRGGVAYYDGAFDDARLAIALARTADDHGALLLNYVAVTGFSKQADGRIVGVELQDQLSGEKLSVAARVVINATGPFSDSVRQLDDDQAKPLIAASQGAHIVVDASFLPGDAAVLIPRTEDGRILFLIPWLGSTLIGTTDTPIDHISLEPQVQRQEIEFLLSTASRWLEQPLTMDDVRSVFVGIRPLVRSGKSALTSALSRDHSIVVDPRSSLVSIVGGKWTTYRKMAEDVVDRSIAVGQLSDLPCRTKELSLHGATASPKSGSLETYGSDADQIHSLMKSDPDLAQRVHAKLPLSAAEVVWACRHEMACTIEDVLARRSRWLLLDARATQLAAAAVAEIMRQELKQDKSWVDQQCQAFAEIAANYCLT